MSYEHDTVLLAVEEARRAGASDADAWLSASRTFSVTVLRGEVEQLEETESRVLGLRVFTGHQTSIVYTSDLTREAIHGLAAQAVELAGLTGADPCAGLPDAAVGLVGSPDDLRLYDESMFSHDPDALIDLARRAEAAARGHDPRITNSEGAEFSRSTSVTALANSRGFLGSYRSSACSLSASALADDEDYKKRVAEWRSSDRFFDRLDDPETVGRTAAEHALRQLGARKVATQEVPVVWSPEMGRALLRLLAMAVSGEARYQGDSFLIGREGEQVASPLLSIVDDSTLRSRLGSRPFDGEGVPSQRTVLFDRGLFSSFLFDKYSACRAGRQSTGHAGRSMAFQRGMSVGVRPSNLSILPGESTPEEVIGGVERGLYLTSMLGHGDNLTTGDFSRGATGIWIENGELAYPVSEINIAGRLQDMLAGVDAVGSDLQVSGTLASPTFRIARMMVSGN